MYILTQYGDHYVSAPNREADRYGGFYELVDHDLIIINHPSSDLPSLLILMPVMIGNTLFLDSHFTVTLQLTVNQICFNTINK